MFLPPSYVFSISKEDNEADIFVIKSVLPRKNDNSNSERIALPMTVPISSVY